MIKNKHLVIERNPRCTHFPYRVQSIGYAFNNPKLNGLKCTFPNKIEFCIRTLSHGENEDKAQMILDGKEYIMSYPHALVKPPNKKYEYRFLDTRDVFYFTYSTDLYPQLEQLGLFDKALSWDIVLTPDVNRLLGQLHDYLEKSSKSGAADRIDLLCFQILSEFLIQKNNQAMNPDPEQELMLQIDSYLKIHFMDNINMDKLAQMHGLSRTSFFRKWARYFKESPAKQLTMLRLQEASRQLIETRFRINEIAQQVNISDTAYFCAVFRKHFGMSPAAYRKAKRLQ